MSCVAAAFFVPLFLSVSFFLLALITHYITFTLSVFVSSVIVSFSFSLWGIIKGLGYPPVIIDPGPNYSFRNSNRREASRSLVPFIVIME